jgi:short chain dehydrogenase
MAGILDERFRKILGNNVLANHWLIQMAAPGMIERNNGSIVIISAIGGLKGSPVIGAYNVSKGRRHSAAAQSRGRMGKAQCSGQLHRARLDPNRLCARLVGGSANVEGCQCANAARAHRRSGRDRRRRRLSRLESRIVHDWTDHRHRRRRDDRGLKADRRVK